MQVVLRRGRKHVEEPLALIAYLQDAGHVAAAIAVVGCAPDGAQAVIVEDLKAFLAELVGTEDMRHVIYCQKLFDDLSAEGIAGAARGETEFVSVCVRVGPDEVGHRSFVGYFAEAVDDFNLIDRVY